MMAKALHESGCPMSLTPFPEHNVTFEDGGFRACGNERSDVEGNHAWEWIAPIEQRNKYWFEGNRSYHWGFKWHPTVWVVDELIQNGTIRNPKIICVYRDLAAVRLAIEGRHEKTYPGQFELFLKQQQQMLWLAGEYGRDVMSVSYGETQKFPELLYYDFKNFTGMNPDRAQFVDWVTDRDVRRVKTHAVSWRGVREV